MEELLAVPQSTFELAASVRRLRAQRESKSFDEIVEERLTAFLDWQAESNPARRRLRRNASLVFTREEIENAIRNEILSGLPYLL